MQYIYQQWKTRSLIILSISMILSALLWTLSLTDWAMAMNSVVSEAHKEPSISPIIIGVVSLVKVTVMTLVPALLCIAVIRINDIITRFVKIRVHNMKMKSS